MRAVAAAFVFAGLRCCGFTRMRMRRVVVSVLRSPAAALVPRAALMMAERHALPGHDRRHALNRHGERDGKCKQAQELQRHGRILLHGF